MGNDRAKLRRRNLIPRSAIPYKTAVGTKYDSGDFTAVFDKALEQSGYAGFKKRRRESARRGRLRGIGISCFLEHSGGSPTEGALITFPGGNVVNLGLHTQSTGQGHASVFPRLVAQKLGIPPEQVRHRHGDTNMGVTGFPSVASRSAMAAGNASIRTAETVITKGRAVTAKAFGVAEDKVSFHDGYFSVAGTNFRLSLF